MNDMTKIVQALEDSNSLLKGITKKFENETKEQTGALLGILRAGCGFNGSLILKNFDSTPSFNKFCNREVLSK